MFPTFIVGGRFMAEIRVGRALDPGMDRGLLDAMFRLRFEVFHRRLGWRVTTRAGREVDGYDRLDPVYMAARRDDGDVVGCWRMLPTTGRYMLRDTFPELLDGEEAPRDPRIWELSRFAVAQAAPGDHRAALVGNTTLEMIREVIEYADDHGIDAYVTVTSVALERLLRRSGIPLHRFGEGRSRRVGHVNSVACWVPVNDEMRAAVGARMPLGRREAA